MTTTIGILLFDDVEELDFVGPWEVFTSARQLFGELEVFTFSERAGAVRAAKGLSVIPDHTLETAPPMDVVLVPGGQGTRREVDNPRLIEFLKRVAPRCRYVTSVCTGALLLHGAGLTEGKSVTTHWAFADSLEARGAHVVRGVRYVSDGNVVTAAGVSAGIDMALWLVGQLFDPARARMVQRAIEYDPEPPYADAGEGEGEGEGANARVNEA